MVRIHLSLLATSVAIGTGLVGCGGGASTPGNTSGPTINPSPNNTPSVQGFPEPAGVLSLNADARAFYDRDKDGLPRLVRNDLEGSLPGMIQFAQSHTVDPKGNAVKEMPTITAERESLLLVTPQPELAGIESLKVTVSVNGSEKGTLTLRHPNDIPRSDYANSDGRPDYVYSRRAWSVTLPWDWVVPGMTLRVVDNKGRVGTLAEQSIDFASPAELVVQSVRIGMLTDPVVSENGHWFRTHPIEAATDYFQTIPVSKITAAYYEDVKLSRVMVASGVIYDAASATTGDVYSGDMRGDTAKSTFSVGINLANWGVTSSGMQSQQQPQVTQSVVIHHARGVYSNGVVTHGLSGGNSILTLVDSRGNEFSHEIGHHFGLGHYPGEINGNYFWSGHHHDSGWGYMGHRKRMRANIHWTRAKDAGLSGMPVLDDTYSFGSDAMAGGHYASSLSLYTHYTGYSARRAQSALDKAVPSAGSSTGYRKWNASTRKMEEFAPSIPNQSAVWFNSANGKFLPPRLHGVPVVTLLGGYDPVTNRALIYPALKGNWGNVFNLPSSAVSTTEPRQCWLDVTFATGSPQRIALAGKRMETNLVNKLHVNLAQSDNPTQAKLQCHTSGQAVEDLYTLDIPQGATAAMPPAVIVGREVGYRALRELELPLLDAALQKLADKKLLMLPESARTLLDSHFEHQQELSLAARTQLARYVDQQERAKRLNRWMSFYASALDEARPEVDNALVTFVRSLGFDENPIIPNGFMVSLLNGSCIQNSADGLRVAARSLCSGEAGDLWIQDDRGSIRSSADLSQCITDQGGSNPVKLITCDVGNERQVWDTATPKRITREGRCLDLRGGSLSNNVGTLITYNCTGGGNQQWGGLSQSSSRALSLSSAMNVHYLERAARRGAVVTP